jgi:hypothetical protein
MHPNPLPKATVEEFLEDVHLFSGIENETVIPKIIFYAFFILY